MSMIKTKFHLLQVQQELGARDPILALQCGLGIGPEILNPVHVPPPTGREALPMVDAIMPVALGDQAVVAGELVRVDRAALGHLLADHGSERLPSHIGDRTGVDLAAPLQEPEDGHFASRAFRPSRK